MNILFCVDGNYWQHLGVAIRSLLHSNPDYTLRIYVCREAGDSRCEALIQAMVSLHPAASIEFLQFSLVGTTGFPLKPELTLATYFRLFMEDYLPPDVRKVIYLDCDVVVNGEIGALWETALDSGYTVAAVPEPCNGDAQALGFTQGTRYFNAGVLLVDVEAWRRERMSRRFLTFLATYKGALKNCDQDVINCVLRHGILAIDCTWNFRADFADMTSEALGIRQAEFASWRRKPAIVHYTGRDKPWYYLYEPHYKNLYYDALMITPWSDFRPSDKTLWNRLFKLARLTFARERMNWYAPSTMAFMRRMAGRTARCPSPPALYQASQQGLLEAVNHDVT